MTTAAVELLDATDTRKRLMQHGATLAGVGLLGAASFLVGRPGLLGAGLVCIALGLGLFAVSASVSQRWQVTYRGHPVRFENNPFRGERLYIDGELVGRGKIGFESELRGTIRSGAGAGDQIVSRSRAGLLTFRCRILAEPLREVQATTPSSISDAQLLAEVRRRGLTSDEP